MTTPESPGRVTAEQEAVRALAPGNSHSMDPESGRRRRRRKHRCVLCCGAATVIIITVVLILAFTVFRVRDPKIRMESIQIDGLSSLTSLSITNPNPNSPNLNVTLLAGLSVKNPNAVSFKFDQTTTSLVYDGRVVGEAEAPSGNARARRTLKLTVTVNVLVQNLVGVSPSRVTRDLLAGRMPVSMSTTVHGRAKVLFIKKGVTVRMNCTMVLNLSTQDIEDLDCNKKVSL